MERDQHGQRASKHGPHAANSGGIRPETQGARGDEAGRAAGVTGAHVPHGRVTVWVGVAGQWSQRDAEFSGPVEPAVGHLVPKFKELSPRLRHSGGLEDYRNRTVIICSDGSVKQLSPLWIAI